MRHLYAIGIKFIIVGTVVLSIYGIFSNASLAILILMGVVVTLASYIIGDLFILPQLGNVFATVIDFGIYFLAVWTLSGLLIGIEVGLTLATLAASYFLTLAEPLFHAYVIERVLDLERERTVIPIEQFQTEAAEEKVISIEELKKDEGKREEDSKGEED